MQPPPEDYNYCERLGPGFWDEPLNAWSNLAFAVSAIAVWMLVERAGSRPQRWTVRALAVIIFLIFLGSGAFHTTATRWGAILDVAFIAVFLLYYVVLFAHLFLDLQWRVAWLGAPIFVGFTVLVSLGADEVGARGPGTYFSALIGLLIVGAALYFSGKPGGRSYGLGFVGAGLLFAVSLTLRTLDGPLCDQIPIGTHFLWHTLNACVLFWVSALAVRRWREQYPLPG